MGSLTLLRRFKITSVRQVQGFPTGLKSADQNLIE
jgi:hypothetical protein